MFFGVRIEMSVFFELGCLKVGLSYEEGCCWVVDELYVRGG